MPIAPLLVLAAAAVQTPAAAPPPPSRHWGRTFISPMGEPFHGADALAEWFAQADRNHDGFLSLDEMQGDAERFFATLDTNHDGEIDPDELTHYEQVIAPEISSGPHFDMAAMGTGTWQGGGGRAGGGHRGGGGGGHHHGGGGDGGGWGGGARSDTEGHQGASRFGLLDLPEPVASADADFNRGVSLAEFRQAAGQRFLALDLDHRGQLTLAALESIRPAPAAQPNRQVTPGEPPTEPSSENISVPSNSWLSAEPGRSANRGPR